VVTECDENGTGLPELFESFQCLT